MKPCMHIHKVNVHRYDQKNYLVHLDKCTIINPSNKWSHAFDLLLARTRLNPMAGSIWDIKPMIPKHFLCCKILYKDDTFEIESHLLTKHPSKTMYSCNLQFRKTLFKNSSLIRIISYQKGESLDFACTWSSVLDWRYLFCNNSYGTSSTFISLNNR